MPTGPCIRLWRENFRRVAALVVHLIYIWNGFFSWFYKQERHTQKVCETLKCCHAKLFQCLKSTLGDQDKIGKYSCPKFMHLLKQTNKQTMYDHSKQHQGYT